MSEENTKIGASTRMGARRQRNEDALLIFTSAHRAVRVVCVFDGHGERGFEAADAARTAAGHFLDLHSAGCEGWSEDHWRLQLVQLFRDMHEAIRTRFLIPPADGAPLLSLSLSLLPSDREDELFLDSLRTVRDGTGQPVRGGTTASVVVEVVASQTLITANVGDSGVLLFGPSSSPTFLSEDHGPDNPEEFRRIERDFAHTPYRLRLVYTRYGRPQEEWPSIFEPDGTLRTLDTLVRAGLRDGLACDTARNDLSSYAATPYLEESRLHDKTCISVTRALGNFYAHEFGLTCEPSVGVHANLSTAAIVVAASDGVWDAWAYDDLSAWLHAPERAALSAQHLAEALVEASVRRASALFGSNGVDDTTAVVWRVRPRRRPTESVM